MDIKEVLTLADELVFASTGKHLDYLQKAILEGTLKRETYAKIAEDIHSSEGHVRDVGSELWRIFSEKLGENITKSNFRTILEKVTFSNFSSTISSTIGSDNLTVNNVNICSERSAALARVQTERSPTQNQTQTRIDLGDAPEIFSFYGRTEELNCLKQWVVQERCRLVALLGMSGIGKTSLALRLIEPIKNKFNFIIYRSLRFSPTLESTLNNLLSVFDEPSNIPQSLELQISQLLKYLRLHRSMIILDDIQMLFSCGQLAGQYQPACANYSLFFQKIVEVNHNSCLMLISSEKPREVAQLEIENHGVFSLIIGSLREEAKEILRDIKLGDEQQWNALIALYQGHPLWLKLTAALIQEFFRGCVSEFLDYQPPILCDSLQFHFNQQLQHLTPLEKQIMLELANGNESLNLSTIIHQTQLSYSEVLKGLQSLNLRLLLKKIEEDKITLFTLDPILKHYLKTPGS